MKNLYLKLLLVLIAGCGFLSPKDKEDKPDLSGIKIKYDTYASLITKHQDSNGFVEVDKCDSLLFSGLISATGIRVNLTAAEEKPGRWLRRPTDYPECWENGESRSTISRDMLLGVYWHAWRAKDLALLERLREYGESRNWFMGDDSIGGLHTVLNPPMIGLLNDMIEKLGGEKRVFTWRISPSEACSGFECHLQMLQLLLYYEIHGQIPSPTVKAIVTIANRNPSNILYSYMKYFFTGTSLKPVIDLMLKTKRYPSSALPSSAEVCESWPVQREDGDKGLKPCPERNEIHSGGDWLFVANLLLR